MLKRQFPIFLASMAGIIPILSSVFDSPGDFLQVQLTDRLEQWMIIISGFALLLGVVSVFKMNLRKISRRDEGWVYAIILLVSLVITAGFGLNAALGGDAFAGKLGFDVWRTNPNETLFEWVQTNIFTPLQATMFSLLAFYVASAAFRAFRVRNLEAGILLGAALVVMLGVNPYGIMLFSWMPSIGNIPGGSDFLPWITNWVMEIPNAAAQRGIIIGAALGAAAMSLRVLLGIERSYLGMGGDGG